MKVRTLIEVLAGKDNEMEISAEVLQNLCNAYEEQLRKNAITRNHEWKDMFSRMGLDGK